MIINFGLFIMMATWEAIKVNVLHALAPHAMLRSFYTANVVQCHPSSEDLTCYHFSMSGSKMVDKHDYEKDRANLKPCNFFRGGAYNTMQYYMPLTTFPGHIKASGGQETRSLCACASHSLETVESCNCKGH